jgi:methylated-DNA-[protein]-cysteine S-methyltransferase
MSVLKQVRIARTSRVIKKNETPTPFQRAVYDLCSQVPKGKVTTYGRIAKALNSSPRAGNSLDGSLLTVVGNALRRNPYAPIVPCHRVIANNLFIGGFQGVWDLNGATAPKKLTLLKNEGVSFDSRGVIRDSRLVYDDFRVESVKLI